MDHAKSLLIELDSPSRSVNHQSTSEPRSRPASNQFERKQTTVEFAREERYSRAQFPAFLPLWIFGVVESTRVREKPGKLLLLSGRHRPLRIRARTGFSARKSRTAKANKEATQGTFRALYPRRSQRQRPSFYQNLRPAGHRNIETLLQANGPHRAMALALSGHGRTVQPKHAQSLACFWNNRRTRRTKPGRSTERPRRFSASSVSFLVGRTKFGLWRGSR